MQDDLNLIWKVEPSAGSGVMSFVRTRVLSLALVAGIGFLLLVSLILDAGLTALGSWLERFGLALQAGLRVLREGRTKHQSGSTMT